MEGPVRNDQGMKSATNSATECMAQLNTDISLDVSRKVISVKSRKSLETIVSLYYYLDTKDQRRTIGDLLSNENAAYIFVQYLKILEDEASQSTGHIDGSIHLIRNICCNYSDISNELCKELGRAEMFPILVKDLVFIEEDCENIPYTLQNSLSILYNCARVVDNRRYLKEAGATEAMIPYLKFENDQLLEIKMVSTLTLSHIMEEKEIEEAGESMIKFILQYLKNANASNLHRHAGFSAEELVDGLLHLAGNDLNKVVIVDCGILPMLVDLMENGTEEEKHVCVEMVWMLSFNDENKQKIREAKLLPLLGKLAQETGQLRKSAIGALWVLRQASRPPYGIVRKPSRAIEDDIDAIEESHPEGSDVEVEREQNAVVTKSLPMDDLDFGINFSQKHIMISYQWDCQRLAIQIKEKLQETKYRVWMDIEEMSGSTLDAMASAVDGSDVVLMCVSQKYKDSKYCRAEAQYAFVRGVPLIPIRVEYGYRPDGWLGRENLDCGLERVALGRFLCVTNLQV